MTATIRIHSGSAAVAVNWPSDGSAITIVVSLVSPFVSGRRIGWNETDASVADARWIENESEAGSGLIEL